MTRDVPPKAPQEPEQMNTQLLALREAVLAISADLSLSEVLQHIVSAAALLVDAKYAALGVPDESGKVLAEFVTTGLGDEERRRIAHPPTGLGLLGLILREGKSFRIREITEDPRSAGFPPGHPPMGSFLGVPILHKGRCLGNLYLTNKIEAQEFSAEDQYQIELLASHAGIAIENARLHEEVQRLIVLEERQRIGMDLHDGVIQSIYAVGLQLEYVRGLLHDGETTRAHERLGNTMENLNQIIRDIRAYILDLRPHQFQGDNLDLGLRRLVSEFKANTLIAADVQLSPAADRMLTGEQRQALFQIVQEALANVAKHARATRVLVRLDADAGTPFLQIEDNGQGLPAADTPRHIGHGLMNMAKRAQTMRAKF